MLREHLSKYGFLWGPEDNPYGISGFMSYGPMGKRLKSKLEDGFRRVFRNNGFEEIETPVLYPRAAFEASGHTSKFKDEMFYTETSSGQALAGRPEMATTIYPLFRKLLDYYQGKMPFKVCQMGIVLPNDRQTERQIRTRQYTAHEGHIVFEAGQANVEETVANLESLAYRLMEAAGILPDRLSFREKVFDEKPFYAEQAYGLYVDRNDGKELELLGVQYRSSRDFIKHSEATGLALKVRGSYPEAFEISFSSDRPFLVLLEQAFRQMDNRSVLQLPHHLAPIPVMVFPHKNIDALHQEAAKLSRLLQNAGLESPVADSGSIGQRYKRADAIGVPFCLTVDERGMDDNSFTIRERDTMQQVRVCYSDLLCLLSSFSSGNPALDLTGKLFELGKNKGK